MCYNQPRGYDDLQSHTYQEATKLAASGEDFSHLIKLLNPDLALRLKNYVISLPRHISQTTIYGRAVTASIPLTAEQKRKQGKK